MAKRIEVKGSKGKVSLEIETELDDAELATAAGGAGASQPPAKKPTDTVDMALQSVAADHASHSPPAQSGPSQADTHAKGPDTHGSTSQPTVTAPHANFVIGTAQLPPGMHVDTSHPTATPPAPPHADFFIGTVQPPGTHIDTSHPTATPPAPPHVDVHIGTVQLPPGVHIDISHPPATPPQSDLQMKVDTHGSSASHPAQPSTGHSDPHATGPTDPHGSTGQPSTTQPGHESPKVSVTLSTGDPSAPSWDTHNTPVTTSHDGTHAGASGGVGFTQTTQIAPNVTVTESGGAGFDAQIGPHGGSASAGAGFTETIQIGNNVTVTEGASAGANASIGPTGASANVQAGFTATVTGPGGTYAGESATAEAGVQAGIQNGNLGAGAHAGASMGDTAGVNHDFNAGHGVTVNANAGVVVSVNANADAEATVGKGGVHVTQGTSAGDYVAVNVGGGVSTEHGGVSGTVGVIAPGSVAEGATVGATLTSDGHVQVTVGGTADVFLAGVTGSTTIDVNAKPLIDFVSAHAPAAEATLNDFQHNIQNQLHNASPQVQAEMGQAMNFLQNQLHSGPPQIQAQVIGVLNNLQDHLHGAPLTPQSGAEALNFLQGQIQGQLHDAPGAGAVLHGLNDAQNFVQDQLQHGANTALNAVHDAQGFIQGLPHGLPGFLQTLQHGGTSVGNTLQNAGQSFGLSVLHTGQTAVNTAQNAGQTALNDVKNVGQQAVTDVKNIGQQAVNTVSSTASSTWHAITSTHW